MHQHPAELLQRRFFFRLVATGLGLVTAILQYKLILASITQHVQVHLLSAHVLLSYCFVFCTTTP